jgi:hypothetical protein
MNQTTQSANILSAKKSDASERTLRMNDFLRQIEAYSNERLDKFLPASQ